MTEPTARVDPRGGTSGGLDGPFLLQLAITGLAITAVNAIRPMVSYRALALGAGPFEIGLLAAVFSIAPAVLAVVVGRAVDRIGEVWFMRAALLAVTVGALMAAMVDLLVLLAVSQSITGLGHVTNLIAGQALVANRGGRQGRDYRYGYYSTMGSMGQLAGPLIGTMLVGEMTGSGPVAAVAGDNAQAPAFLAAALLAFVAFVLAWLLPARRPPEGTLDSQGGGGVLRSAAAVIRRPGMPMAMIVSMIVVSSVDVLIAYLPLYGESRGIAVTTIGLLLAIRAGASMVSRFFMGYLIARLGRNLLVALSMAAATIGLTILPFVAEPVALAVLMALIGLGLGIGQPMTMAWVANRSPRAERGTALGVRLTGNRTALIVVPILVGAVAGTTGVGIVFWLLAGLLGVGAIVGYRAPLDTPPPPRVGTGAAG